MTEPKTGLTSEDEAEAQTREAFESWHEKYPDHDVWQAWKASSRRTLVKWNERCYQEGNDAGRREGWREAIEFIKQWGRHDDSAKASAYWLESEFKKRFGEEGAK